MHEEERGHANRQRDPGAGARKGRRRNGGKEEKRNLGSQRLPRETKPAGEEQKDGEPVFARARRAEEREGAGRNEREKPNGSKTRGKICDCSLRTDKLICVT